jgi:hypothetical protein
MNPARVALDSMRIMGVVSLMKGMVYQVYQRIKFIKGSKVREMRCPLYGALSFLCRQHAIESPGCQIGRVGTARGRFICDLPSFLAQLSHGLTVSRLQDQHV